MKARYGLDLFYHKRKTFAIKFIIASFAIVFVTLLSFIFIKFIGNKFFKLDSVDTKTGRSTRKMVINLFIVQLQKFLMKILIIMLLLLFWATVHLCWLNQRLTI